MAVLLKKYVDLNDVMRHIRLQIEESIPFAESYVPQFRSPIDLFHWLKPQLKYRKDPQGKELLQSFPTLIKNNFYGISGTGDCDCFSIAMCSATAIQQWKGMKVWIKLAGRNRSQAVHIWSGVDINGKSYPLDLTNPTPLYERNYQYIQKLYLK